MTPRTVPTFLWQLPFFPARKTGPSVPYCDYVSVFSWEYGNDAEVFAVFSLALFHLFNVEPSWRIFSNNATVVHCFEMVLFAPEGIFVFFFFSLLRSEALAVRLLAVPCSPPFIPRARRTKIRPGVAVISSCFSKNIVTPVIVVFVIVLGLRSPAVTRWVPNR